jgi:hypothetical protein
MDHEQFEALNPEEQERVFHQSPFKEKGDLILHSHHPERLAQSLSQEELYLVTREVDLEERCAIIRYANVEQLLFISDIDCWRKDRIHPQGFLQWLELLKEADERKLLAWLLEMDYETVVSGFKGLLRVLKPEWEYPTDEMLGSQPYFTLDERYFISVQEENLETVRRAIEILFENHKGRYVAILEGILGELDDVAEEEAYRRRELRLGDRGFPDPETAHRIYRPISEEEFAQFPNKNQSPAQAKERSSSSKFRIPHYPVLWSAERFFLDEVLLLFRQETPEVSEGIEEELAWLSNKVIACQGIDFSSEDRVRQGAERVRRFVSIGLELLSGGDIAMACQIMKERWLEMIFRWAVTRLLKIRDDASGVVHNHWKGSKNQFLEFVNAPYEFIFRGLLQSVPECYDQRVTEHPFHLRDFKNSVELENAQSAVRQIDSILQWPEAQFPHWLERLSPEMGRGYLNISLYSMLGTLFARFVLYGKISPEPISSQEAGRFLQEGFEERGNRRILKSLGKESFLNHFFSNEQQSLLRPLWSLVFEELDEELGGFDLSRHLDPRFIATLTVFPPPVSRRKKTSKS